MQSAPQNSEMGMNEYSEFKTTREWAEWVFETTDLSKEAFDEESAEIRDSIEWLSPNFDNGRRRCKLVPEEWDFRRVADLQEARAACSYEYRREVPLAYEWTADWHKFVGKDPQYAALLKFALNHKWPAAPDAWLLISRHAHLFPMPWLKRPDSLRTVEFDPIETVQDITFDPKDREWLGAKSRAHAIVIHWDNPIAEIKRDLAKLVDALRPSEFPKVKPKRGKRISKPFDELKWLAAWRLESAGLSYDQAQAFLEKHAAGNDPNGVIPRYASSGAWRTHAIDKARSLITRKIKNTL